MKKLIKKLINKIGFDVIRHKEKEAIKKSVRSTALSFHVTETGSYYLPSDAHDDIVANTIKKGKIFEKDVVSLARKYIKPGTVVLDIGSNFGQMSVLFAESVGESGKVYAFDADDFVFDILKRNIEANKMNDRIIATFGAVHNRDNEVLFFPVQDFERFGSYGSYGIDYKGQKGRRVSAFTIDSLDIKEPISFMKVDVQGGDLYAMQGAKKTIQSNKMPILFEYEYHFEDELDMCFQDYVDFVLEIGYKFEKVINGHNYLIVPK